MVDLVQALENWNRPCIQSSSAHIFRALSFRQYFHSCNHKLIKAGSVLIISNLLNSRINSRVS